MTTPQPQQATAYSDAIDQDTKELMKKTQGQDTSAMESALAACHMADYYEKVKGDGNSEAR